jgi:hypothetical protein
MNALRRLVAQMPQVVPAVRLAIGSLVGSALGDIALGALAGGTAGLGVVAWLAGPDEEDMR